MEAGARVWWDRILDIFYPSSCLGCGETLQYSREELFCPLCRLSVLISDCHLNVHHPLKDRMRLHFPFELVLSKYRYPDGSRTMTGLIRGLKYENMKHIGYLEGIEYGKIIQPVLEKAEVTALVPVPLHRKKRIKRGYNQSVEWARGLSAGTGLPVYEKIVRRIKNTKSQTELNKRERQHNMRRAFRVAGEWRHPDSAHFLLLDDVVTSGTTLTELAREMQHHFPESKFSVCTMMYRDY